MIVGRHNGRHKRADRQRGEQYRKLCLTGEREVSAYDRERPHKREDKHVPEREVLLAFGTIRVEVTAEQPGQPDK
ncbi:MAG TPA: hypothetical protein VEY13_03880 [Rubrobacteraceae bacterium]|nr:hypothetical protein [Rubrobacteraceae bacterium]